MEFKIEKISVTCPCCGQTRQMAVRIPYKDNIKTSEEILMEMAKDAEEEYRLLKIVEEEDDGN